MSKGTLKIATCQFAVSDSIKSNSRQICGFMHKARQLKADIIHFPESALSGYIGVDFPNFDNFDWELLRCETEKIMTLAGELNLWVVLGSFHRLTEPNKPHNCLYLINSQGQIVDRYDKRFCTKGEIRRLTPGNRFVTFNLNGVKCSLLICFDVRFCELYRELCRQGVKCIFQSFYNARQKGPSVHTYIMRQSVQCMAAANNFWASMSNASGYYSPYPSCFIQPDGKIVAQLKSNKSGIMVNTVDLNLKFYDPSEDFRDIAINGKLTNSTIEIDDPRSKNITSL